MASRNPSLISDFEEQKWVAEINEILNQQLKINFQSTPSVSLFQVPQTITTKKPEAYEPQHIGLGPIHHFGTQLYKKMEQKKIDVVRSVLQDCEIKDFKVDVVDKVEQLVPIVRSSYDMFLQSDDKSLAWVFAIDGLFLLNLFHTRENYKEKNRLMVQDIFMVENQIPFMVLKEIDVALHLKPSGNSSSSTHEFSPNSVFRTFCEIHSPLELCSNDQALSSVDHLLHYMYSSIVNNITVQASNNQDRDRFRKMPKQGVLPSKAKQLDRPVKWPFAGNFYNFFNKISHKEIVQAYKQTISILETFSQSKILIPSASKLHDEVGFKFHSLEQYQGIQNISVREKKINLPRVTLNNDSEVVLRNMVAYETIKADTDSFLLTEYMSLMCALVTNVDDVKLLKRQKVIKGNLGEDEIAQLFIGMSSSVPTLKAERKSKLYFTILEIKKVYESRPMMKTYLLLKKLAHSLLVVLKAVGGFVEASWKIVAFMVSIVTAFLLTWQAYCDVFGCSKMRAKLLPYASI